MADGMSPIELAIINHLSASCDQWLTPSVSGDHLPDVRAIARIVADVIPDVAGLQAELDRTRRLLKVWQLLSDAQDETYRTLVGVLREVTSG